MTNLDLTSALSAGLARADITPPVGIRSTGFAARGPLTAHHDPLYATAIVFAAGEHRAAIVSCDLLGLDAETVGAVRAEVSRRTGIDGAWVTVACTHTHYGPDPYRDKASPDVQAYRANLIHVLAGAVQEAAERPVPVRLGVAWGESSIGINRRERLDDGRIVLGNNPSGPIDRTVGVLRIDDAQGAPLACVVNFQTHPVCQGSTISHISADYVGRARDVVESLTGATFVFLQGACGNINPIRMEPTYEVAHTLGTRLGCETARIWETIAPQPGAGLAVESRPIRLPRIRYGSREQAEALVRSLEESLAALQNSGGSDGQIWWIERRLERAREALASWTTGVLPTPVESEVQAWRIGPLALSTAPGEIFCQLGQQVKRRSPVGHTFFVGYADDSIGYVPVPEAYAEGGYEVTHASQVDPEAADILVEGCLAALAASVAAHS